MKFSEVETEENFPIVKFESENKVWEWGLTPMGFGVRVRVGQVGWPCVEIDYCAGPDVADQMFWLGCITAIMHGLPENITARALCDLFPRQTIKPMRLDKECQEKLFELGQTVNGWKVGHL